MDEFLVTSNLTGIRIDKFLSNIIENVSRSQIQSLITSGKISVNGNHTKSNYVTRENDVISVVLPEPEETQVLPENIPLDILYEDSHIIVLNKSQGMVVHPAAGHFSGTLVNALMYHCGSSLSGINGKIRPGIVHRIDMDTSGVLVAAKTNQAHIFLSEQLANHSMLRTYHALAHGNIVNDSGIVNTSVGRSVKDRKKMAAGVKNGKTAVTHYKVLERFEKFTYIQLNLETGRTHQIRVHMASIGHPLLGDCVYGNSKNPYSLHGQALHAKTLGFLHPANSKYMEFDTVLPDYFLKIIGSHTRRLEI